MAHSATLVCGGLNRGSGRTKRAPTPSEWNRLNHAPTSVIDPASARSSLMPCLTAASLALSHIDCVPTLAGLMNTATDDNPGVTSARSSMLFDEISGRYAARPVVF